VIIVNLSDFETIHSKKVTLAPATGGFFSKISPNCQRNVTAVFVTLSLNNLGFGDYFRFFAPVNFCKRENGF